MTAKKIIISVIVVALILLIGILVWPKPEKKIYRIGGLVSSDSFLPAWEGFVKQMAALGYIEGENVVYDLKNAKGDKKKIIEFAQKLTEDYKAGKLDIIVTSSTTATQPIQEITKGTGIPVVFLSAGNPRILVENLEKPGGNLTGINAGAIDLIPKEIEILLKIDPSIKKLIVPMNKKSANYPDYSKLIRETVSALAIELVEIQLKDESAEEAARIAKSITKEMGDAIFLPPDAIITNQTTIFAEQAKKEGLPSMTPILEEAKKGILVTYSPSYFSMGKQGAFMVDKVLHGASPANLPVELPEKIEMIINLKTAKAIGLTISPELLKQAQVIEE